MFCPVQQSSIPQFSRPVLLCCDYIRFDPGLPLLDLKPYAHIRYLFLFPNDSQQVVLRAGSLLQRAAKRELIGRRARIREGKLRVPGTIQNYSSSF